MSTQVPQRDGSTERRRRLITLVVASVSAAVAAVVVRKIWGPGTVFGAAATPIIIAFVADALNRPAEKIRTVAVPARSSSRPAAVTPPRTHGRPRPRGVDGRPQEAAVQAGAGLTMPRVGRRGLLAALGFGLVAFVLGVGLLTGGELVFGGSAGPNERRTTLLGGPTTKSKQQQDEQQKPPAVPGQTSPSTTATTTETTTETTPAPPPPTETDDQPADSGKDPPAEAPPPDGTTGP